YRRGGPLTVTDCNVLLGRIQANAFPAVFGESGREPIDVAVVREKFAGLAARIAEATGVAHTPEQVAEGFLKVAVNNMANAIKFISVERGHDVTGYVLNCFGGAGGQHACRVAETLGMSRVLVHPLAGVLSAFGMGQAPLSTLLEQSLELELAPQNLPAAAAALDELAGRACAAVAAQGIDASRIAVERRAHLKYRGTDTALAVRWDAPEAMQAAFAAAYRRRFSFLLEGLPLVIDAVSVEATGHDVGALPPPVAPTAAGRATGACAREQVEMLVAGARATVPLFDRADLEPGAVMDGPAIVVDPQSTTVVEPGWRARVLGDGSLLLERHADATHQAVGDSRPDPVMLEVFNNLFMSIAEQMGVALANTASSVNIKERLDFSCALFDGQANLIANAPHMPVHLGSMGDSVRTIAQRNAGRMQRGDVYVLNDPYNGGTHLPDVTVVTPVFLEDSAAKPDFFVASRGHHADIGGITPGSMPPFSKTVEEEGVLLDNFRYVSAGRADDAGLLARLTGARYPARNPAQNLADLRAQIAANEKGVQELRQMVAHFGERTVKAYMQHVQDNAEAAVRRAIGALKDGAFRYEMDSGAVIAVKVTIGQDRQSATIDFSGTSAAQDSNFNAPSSVVTAAVLYVFRMLVDSDIPLNAGCLKPLTLVIPEGSMLRPHPPAATVAGNVETSQCITDALIGAMGIMAASSGTMNNLTFGNATHQYYETVSGGSGAGPGYHGTDAVQVHMTNSRLTDPEVLELRFPVRIEAHAIRKGSGGRGRWCGGNGAVRRIRFLQPMTAAILSGHRRIANFGMAGGGPGGLGRTWIERADGTIEELAYADQTEVGIGDVLVLETPGGGGYGRADAPQGAM
ncbi:MAG TPA: hydantoinase B/oxoprolinase family protein, partial [Usitatibacteraceae bacterium]|nr:hydantoinase B/oxoprolinase family protein [Usitatibacteraceae bacterium]